MGLSYKRLAGDTLDAIQHACMKQLAERGERIANVWYVNDKRYFYEVSGRNQPDGGICGTIHVCLGASECRKVGTFRIDSRGKVVRGPKFFKEAALHKENHADSF